MLMGEKMSTAMQFLEEMGSDSSSGRLSAEEYAAGVARLDADEAKRRELMERDHAELNALLGECEKAMALVATSIDENWSCEEQSSEAHQAA